MLMKHSFNTKLFLTNIVVEKTKQIHLQIVWSLNPTFIWYRSILCRERVIYLFKDHKLVENISALPSYFL